MVAAGGEVWAVNHLIFLGTYTGDNGSAGIYAARFDEETGALALAGPTYFVENPTFLAVDRARRRLLVASEVDDGQIVSLRYDPDTGALAAAEGQSAQGSYPCHVSLTPDGRFALTASYGDGRIAILPIAADGTLEAASDAVQHEGAGPHESQKGPHAHMMIPDPSGRFALAADLGCDRVFVYTITADGKLVPQSEGIVPPGSGPRHLTFSGDGRFAYLINEHGSTITVFAWDAAAGTLTAVQRVPTLPDDFSDRNACADIHLSPDGRFCYGSNRGHDSLVRFAVDAETGALSPLGHVGTGIDNPRNFALDPSGAFVLVANQDTHDVIVFRRESQTGALIETSERIAVPAPVCIVFA
jgi:6-phosphogluconolactonase